MRTRRTWAVAIVALFVGCGGSGSAKAPSDVTMTDVEKQTRAACGELQSCDLIDEGAEALEDCVSRGLHTVDGGTKRCGQAYWEFEACVADLGCGDLEALFKAGDESAPCRRQADTVELECNVSVL